jgi:hypothetical protein
VPSFSHHIRVKLVIFNGSIAMTSVVFPILEIVNMAVPKLVRGGDNLIHQHLVLLELLLLVIKLLLSLLDLLIELRHLLLVLLELLSMLP